MNTLTPETLKKYQQQNRLLPFDPLRGYKKNQVKRLASDLITYEGAEYYRVYTHNQQEIWVRST